MHWVIWNFVAGSPLSRTTTYQLTEMGNSVYSSEDDFKDSDDWPCDNSDDSPFVDSSSGNYVK